MESERMNRMNRMIRYAVVVSLLVAGGQLAVSGRQSEDALERGFRTPPDSAKPRVWWHWMIGDQFLPEDKRYTFSLLKPYKKDSPLLESGLIGPVRLVATQ